MAGLRGTSGHCERGTGDSEVARWTQRGILEDNNGILEYIKGLSGYDMTFQRGLMTDLLMRVSTDADYASARLMGDRFEEGKKMCGSACECWFPRTQGCVTLSTTKAEYVVMAETTEVLLFLHQAWCFMLPGVFEVTGLAVWLAQNPVTNSISKHVDVRHHFLRKQVATGTISVSRARRNSNMLIFCSFLD